MGIEEEKRIKVMVPQLLSRFTSLFNRLFVNFYCYLVNYL